MRRLRYRIAVVAVVFAGAALSSITVGGNAAQPMIKGTIRDENGRTLPNVDVFAVDHRGNDKHATSDMNGAYGVSMPKAREVKLVLFDTTDANAKRMTVALHIDATANNEVSWILQPLGSLDKSTRDYFVTTLRRAVAESKSERLKAKGAEFLLTVESEPVTIISVAVHFIVEDDDKEEDAFFHVQVKRDGKEIVNKEKWGAGDSWKDQTEHEAAMPIDGKVPLNGRYVLKSMLGGKNVEVSGKYYLEIVDSDGIVHKSAMSRRVRLDDEDRVFEMEFEVK